MMQLHEIATLNTDAKISSKYYNDILFNYVDEWLYSGEKPSDISTFQKPLKELSFSQIMKGISIVANFLGVIADSYERRKENERP